MVNGGRLWSDSDLTVVMVVQDLKSGSNLVFSFLETFPFNGNPTFPREGVGIKFGCFHSRKCNLTENIILNCKSNIGMLHF